MKSKPAIVLALVLLLAFGFYVCFGFFVIQPIGALPEGATVFYWRAGLNLPFVSSADGILLEQKGSVSLLGRGIVMGRVAETIGDRKIATLPYSSALYMISTGGKEFDR